MDPPKVAGKSLGEWGERLYLLSHLEKPAECYPALVCTRWGGEPPCALPGHDAVSLPSALGLVKPQIQLFFTPRGFPDLPIEKGPHPPARHPLLPSTQG